MNTIIEFRNVSKSFGGRQVLADVDIIVERGETLAIIGGSGTGKSVFLKHILGVLAPDTGQVLFEGRDVALMTEAELIAMRRRIGMLFQGAALFDSLTVAENISYPLREQAHETEEKLQRIVAEKLRLVGLLGIEAMMPNDLSGGMKKRVGLARAIATNPDMILYDEPTAGLDPANTKRICRLIVELQEKLQVTSIVVTHDMESAFAITDRIALLSGGKFAFIGTASEARASINPLVQHFIEGDTESMMKREEP